MLPLFGGYITEHLEKRIVELVEYLLELGKRSVNETKSFAEYFEMTVKHSHLNILESFIPY